jgi:hypothetical protein
MISLAIARELKNAGLVWEARINDYFAIPDRGMDERVFVISELQADLDVLRGWPVVTFHGAAEWALDYILTTEVVWMPTEEQLRELLVTALDRLGDAWLQLELQNESYRCRLRRQNRVLEFAAEDGSGAYAGALLYLLHEGDRENVT